MNSWWSNCWKKYEFDDNKRKNIEKKKQLKTLFDDEIEGNNEEERDNRVFKENFIISGIDHCDDWWWEKKTETKKGEKDKQTNKRLTDLFSIFKKAHIYKKIGKRNHTLILKNNNI